MHRLKSDFHPLARRTRPDSDCYLIISLFTLVSTTEDHQPAAGQAARPHLQFPQAVRPLFAGAGLQEVAPGLLRRAPVGPGVPSARVRGPARLQPRLAARHDQRALRQRAAFYRVVG